LSYASASSRIFYLAAVRNQRRDCTSKSQDVAIVATAFPRKHRLRHALLARRVTDRLRSLLRAEVVENPPHGEAFERPARDQRRSVDDLHRPSGRALSAASLRLSRRTLKIANTVSNTLKRVRGTPGHLPFACRRRRSEFQPPVKTPLEPFAAARPSKMPSLPSSFASNRAAALGNWRNSRVAHGILSAQG
jgi:hypothetical protein